MGSAGGGLGGGGWVAAARKAAASVGRAPVDSRVAALRVEVVKGGGWAAAGDSVASADMRGAAGGGLGGDGKGSRRGLSGDDEGGGLCVAGVD